MNEDIGVQVNTLNAIFSQVQAVQAVSEKLNFVENFLFSVKHLTKTHHLLTIRIGQKKQELTKKCFESFGIHRDLLTTTYVHTIRRKLKFNVLQRKYYVVYFLERISLFHKIFFDT